MIFLQKINDFLTEYNINYRTNVSKFATHSERYRRSAEVQRRNYMMHKVMTGARSLTLKAPFLLTKTNVVMNTEKRLCGIEKKRDYLSSQLEKRFHFMFMRLMEVGYNHNDIYQFCQHWLSIYNCYEKVNDKLLLMSDDLPF